MTLDATDPIVELDEIEEPDFTEEEIADLTQFSEDIAEGRIVLGEAPVHWDSDAYQPDPNEPTVMDVLILVDDIADFRQFAADVAAGRIDLSKYPRAADLADDEPELDEPIVMDLPLDEGE